MAPSYTANAPVQYFSPRAQESSHASFSRYLLTIEDVPENDYSAPVHCGLTSNEFLDVALKLGCSLPQTLQHIS